MSLTPAPDELAEFVAKSRRDWPRNLIDGAFEAARNAGTPWPQFFQIVLDALLRERGSTYDILAEIRGPVGLPPGVPPNREFTRALDAMLAEAGQARPGADDGRP